MGHPVERITVEALAFLRYLVTAPSLSTKHSWRQLRRLATIFVTIYVLYIHVEEEESRIKTRGDEEE